MTTTAPSAVDGRSTAVRPTDRVASTKAERSRFRPDIEGLRAIAVLLVVLYHFGLLGLHGGYVGVDVFFVISGYLITQQLVRSVGQPGSAGSVFARFYAGRFRRLLPAAGLTIVVTVVVTAMYAPVLLRKSIFTDAIWSSLYSINYRLAIEGTQYSQIGTAASPLQHFWSLAVEEQFYFVWPSLVIGLAMLFRSHWRRALTTTVTIIVVGSFVASVVVTKASQPWAYFGLPTRAWELGLGALLGIVPALSLASHCWLSTLTAAGGVALILWSAWSFTDETPFPGWSAAVPVVGAALVLLAGCAEAGGPMSWALGNSLAQFIGRMSYSWYLWHWPLLVLAPYVLGHALSLSERLILLIVTFVVATQSFWIVEQPTRVWRLVTGRWIAGGLGSAAGIAVVALALVTTQGAVTGGGQAAASVSLGSDASTAERQVSAELTQALTVTSVPRNLTPTIERAPNDVMNTHYNGCHADYTATAVPNCVYGDPTGAHTAVVFGDSHVEQWTPGLDAAGKAAGWRIINWTKSGCPFGRTTLFNDSLNRNYTECNTWRAAALERIAALKPDRVIVSGAEDLADGRVSDQQWVADSVATIEQIRSMGISVTFIEDTPVARTVIPQCAADNLTDAGRCDFTVTQAIIRPQRHAALAAAIGSAGAKVVDPLPWMCVNNTCPIIAGNILIYRDDNHVTATFSRWLSPVLKDLFT